MRPTETVYLDWNATAPPLGAVVEAMGAAAREAWGNPASIHAVGRAARRCVDDARTAIGELVGADPRDVVLTSGATEANNIALRSAFAAERGVLVTSRLEHPSVARVAEALERERLAEVRWVRVLEDGRIDLTDLGRALAAGGVRLVAVQAVNHETGVIQEIDEIIRLAHAAGARVHVDVVQAVGRVDVGAAAADTRSVAAHKIRGPKGIGALVTRSSARLSPVLVGGSQERGIRPGTVDPVACAGFAVAARHALSSPERYRGIASLRDALEGRLLEAVAGGRVNGTAPRAPHVTSFTFPGWNGPEMVAALDLEGVAVASGSACSAGTAEPSPSIRAMFDDARAASSVRISLGETTSRADIDAAIAAFERVLAR